MLNAYLKAAAKTASKAPDTLKRGRSLQEVFRQNLAVGLRPETVTTKINSIQIEPTKRCNQQCPMCTQPRLSKDEKGDMSFEQFRNIIDQLPHVTSLKLQGLGEIFVNREIWSMLEYARNKKIRTLFATNGFLLKPNSCQQLCELGDVDVRFSMDTLDPVQYKRIRGIDHFERVKSNIALFTNTKIQYAQSHRGRKLPSAEIRMVCMDENLNQLVDMIRFAGEVGLNRVTATFMLSKKHDTDQSSFVSGKTNDLLRRGLGQLEQTAGIEARKQGVQFKILPYYTNILQTCDWPWRMPYITYDGYLTPCCHVENPKAGNLGNVFDNSFEEIWNGPAYRDFRRNFTDLKKNTICRVCPFLSEDDINAALNNTAQ
jgi:radical SAM protein with 4Fe4S-binding SPASM domain